MFTDVYISAIFWAKNYFHNVYYLKSDFESVDSDLLPSEATTAGEATSVVEVSSAGEATSTGEAYFSQWSDLSEAISVYTDCAVLGNQPGVLSCLSADSAALLLPSADSYLRLFYL